MRRLALAAATAATLALVPAAPAVAAAPVDAPVAEVTVSEIDLDGPRISPIDVTVTNTGSASLQQLVVTLDGPIGWTIQPATVTVSGALKPGRSVTAGFQVRVPEPREEFVLRTFTATATYRSQGTDGVATGSRTQSTGTAYTDLAEIYNNVGVTDESNPAPGNFDGGGNSYSAQALAVAGVEPGTVVSALGAELTWPDVPAGTPNNVVARGQTITLDGSGERLVFLGSATGFGSGTVTISYTDGSVAREPIGFPNWCCADPTQHGAVSVIEMDHRNTPSGPANYGITYRVFANSVPLDPAKTVAYVTLPSQPAIHIFDMAMV